MCSTARAVNTKLELFPRSSKTPKRPLTTGGLVVALGYPKVVMLGKDYLSCMDRLPLGQDLACLGFG